MSPAQALEFAPPTPACFPSRESWASYLLAAQDLAERERQVARPFDEGMRYRPIFNFCTDCEAGHAKRMRMARKCTPGQFRGVAIVTAKALA